MRKAMLDEKTVALVKSTAPVLAENGEVLTRHFYKRMFTHNPEVAPYFNQANQTGGKQQRALAGAIVAYAANIDHLEVLGGAVELIAQKHASLMIKPEHYPIVGENLLASIREVLGEAATDDIINAWAAAYGFLADILMGRERQIYGENAKKPGGWEGFKLLRVSRKEKESSNITSFYLVAEDGSPLSAFKPGQYLTVRVKTPDGQTTMRNYSLSDMPGKPHFRISVKREMPEANTPQGYVSNLLHDAVEPGHTLEVAPPCGEFFLDVTEKHERPLVLLAAGVGITPIMSILLSALEAFPKRQILFVHAVLNEEVQPFRKTVDELVRQHTNLRAYHRYSEGGSPSDNASIGFVTAEYLEGLLSSRDADYYFCGPQPFMVSIYQELLKWGIPASQVHFEFFGPRQELERAA
jgi:nitric oxide dioxygenase